MVEASPASPEASVSTKVRRGALWGCGVMASFLWFGWVNNSNAVLNCMGHWQTIYAVLALSLAVIALASFLVGKRKGDELLIVRAPDQATAASDFSSSHSAFALASLGKRLDWFCAIVMVACVMILFLARRGAVLAPLVVLATLLGGAALGWQYARWGRFFASCEASDAVAGILGAAVVWPLVEIGLEMVPFELSSLVIACCPVLSLVALREAAGHYRCRLMAELRTPSMDRSAFVKVWFVIFSVSLILSVFLGVRAADPSPFGAGGFMVSNLLTSLCCLLLLVWALWTSLPFGFSLFWKTLAVVLGLACLLSTFPEAEPLAQGFTRIVPGMLVPMVWLTACDAGRRSSHPGAMVCALMTAYSVAMCASAVLGSVLPLFVQGASLTALFLFLLLMVAALLETRDPDMGRIFAELRTRVFEPVEFVSIDGRCREVGGRSGLTDREIEIMAMICKGHSRSFIAEALYITENTVKSHTSHIYGKLGVHSRRELQQLVCL